MTQVFVYGTLKRGQRNSHYLREADYRGEFTTDKAYSMYLFVDYPAVCLSGNNAIQGEVYRINSAQLMALDELEGYPDFYQRVEIETHHGRAWMYVVQPELCRDKPLLPGIWG